MAKEVPGLGLPQTPPRNSKHWGGSLPPPVSPYNSLLPPLGAAGRIDHSNIGPRPPCKTFKKESPKALCFWIPKCPQTLTTFGHLLGSFGGRFGPQTGRGGAKMGPRGPSRVPENETTKSRKWFPHGTASISVAPNGTPQAKLLRSWLSRTFLKTKLVSGRGSTAWATAWAKAFQGLISLLRAL